MADQIVLKQRKGNVDLDELNDVNATSPSEGQVLRWNASASEWALSASSSVLDWQESVKDKDLTAPPVSPSDGDRYIVAAGATGALSEEEKIKMIDAMKEFETMLLRINEQSKVQIDEESVNEMTSQLSTKLESLNINDESILSLSENVKDALSIKDTAIDALNEKIEEIRGYNTKLIKMNDVAIEDIAVLAKLVAKTIPEDKLEECLNEIKDDSE